MKQPFLAALCVLQLLQGSTALAGMGSSADIAKYTSFNDLSVSGHKFYTAELRKFYATRSNRAVWFENGSSNWKLDIYLAYVRAADDATYENKTIWSLMAEDYYSDANAQTWITAEIVATYSLLNYVNGRGVKDYTNLNKALAGDSYDLQYYLQTLKVQGGQPTAIAPPGSIPDVNVNVNIGGGAITGEAAPPVVGQAAVQPIGLSNMRYANDPSAADVSALYMGSFQNLFMDLFSRPNAMAASLRQLLRDAASQGLNPDDYWDSNLESLYKSSAGAEFERQAATAFLRYVNHLTRGRIDPQTIDPKLLQFQLKKFEDVKVLNGILRDSPESLATSVLQLAPQLPQYQKLVGVLQRLTVLRDSGQWKKIGEPGRTLKMGETNAIIGAVRTRLSQLGYPGAGSGNIYDESFATVTKLFLASNGLPGTIDYRFWTSLNKSVDERIQSVRVNMEKMRWVPRDARTRYVFVNLAAQEVRLIDQGQVLMKFRTVNGRAERPTPSMMQQIRSVILNPTWTVPPTLAIQDKMPVILKDPDYMQMHNMYILDTSNRSYLYSLDEVDMSKFTDSAKTTRYYFVQGPGNSNALGVIKFPLSNMDGSANKDDIYLHDTNERNLFAESNRLRSSGCIRLQFPMEFGAQVLKDKNMSVDDIRAKVPWDDPTQIVSQDQTNQQISLPKSLPVYIMFLTAEQSDEGGARFFEDAYGLDAKILVAMKTSL